MEVILSWQQNGFSIRHVMVEALVKMNRESTVQYVEQMGQVTEKLDNLFDLLCSGRANRFEGGTSEVADNHPKELSDQFLASVKVGMKPGLRMG